MTQLYQLKTRPQPPASELEAEAAMVRNLTELANRCGFHGGAFGSLWGPGLTPDERIAGLNA